MSILELSEVERRVAEIEAIDGDPEAAHSDEDSLYEDVLRAISFGATNPRELASAALKTKDLDFPRWCA